MTFSPPDIPLFPLTTLKHRRPAKKLAFPLLSFVYNTLNGFLQQDTLLAPPCLPLRVSPSSNDAPVLVRLGNGFPFPVILDPNFSLATVITSTFSRLPLI